MSLKKKTHDMRRGLMTTLVIKGAQCLEYLMRTKAFYTKREQNAFYEKGVEKIVQRMYVFHLL